MRLAVRLASLVALMLAGIPAGQAGDCIIVGSLPRLNSESLQWTFEIAGGRRCLRGLRSSAMIIDSVVLMVRF